MANVSFNRGDNTKMDNTPITDGLIFINTEESEIFFDNNDTRISIGGSGGGHVIQNPAGTSVAQEPNMQFKDARITDDSTNEKTVVEVVDEKTLAQFNALPLTGSADGIYVIGDGQGGSGIDASEINYDNTTSGMTATDVQDAIDELNADMDIDLSDTSLPSSTTFNALIQMMAERLYPQTAVALIPTDMTGNTTVDGTVSFNGTSTVSDYNGYSIGLNDSSSWDVLNQSLATVQSNIYKLFNSAENRMVAVSLYVTSMDVVYTFTNPVVVKSVVLSRIVVSNGSTYQTTSGQFTVAVQRNGSWQTIYTKTYPSASGAQGDFDITIGVPDAYSNNVSAIKVSCDSNASTWTKQLGYFQAYGYK